MCTIQSVRNTQNSKSIKSEGQTQGSQVRDGKDFECRSQQNPLYLVLFPGALLPTGLSCIADKTGLPEHRHTTSRSSEIFWLVPRGWSDSGCCVQQDPHLPAFLMEMTAAEVREVQRSCCTQPAMCVCAVRHPEHQSCCRCMDGSPLCVLGSPGLGCRTNQCREGVFLGIFKDDPYNVWQLRQ